MSAATFPRVFGAVNPKGPAAGRLGGTKRVRPANGGTYPCRMSSSITLPTPEVIAAVCRALSPAHQSLLLEFAQFLQAQEAQAALDDVDEEDEAEWDRLLTDPARAANFARWADESLARSVTAETNPPTR